MPIDTYVISSSGKATIVKDPQAVLDYVQDWVSWLDEDTIVSCEVEVVGVALQSKGHSATKVTAWITGGAVGAENLVVFTITTAAGRTDSRTIHFKIKER